MVVAVFWVDGAILILKVWQSGQGAWRTGLAFVLLASTVYIQMAYFSRPASWLRSPRSFALLAMQAGLIYLPLLMFDSSWNGLQNFLAGSVLLVLPPVAAWLLFVAVVATVPLLQYAMIVNVGPIFLLYNLLGSAVVGIAVYLLSRLAGLVGELHTARDDLAQLAVADERLRFARDLHDLLGLSLSAITLKGELAHRLVHARPERANQEVTELLDVARLALADVRSVARGYQDLSLEQEARSAKAVLAASDIDTRLDLEYQDLSVPVITTLAAVLHEGVTNVLRHSKAERCEIVVHQAAGEVSVDILNDGVSDENDNGPDAGGGSGIRNLSTRVAELSGWTTAGLEPDGRFRLRVVIPCATEKFESEDPPAGTFGGRSGKGTRSTTVPSDPGPPGAAIRERTTSPVHARSTAVLISLFFAGDVLIAVLHLMVLTKDPVKLVSGIDFLTALLILQLAYVNRVGSRPRSGLSYVLLLVQACLIYLPLIQLGPVWISQPGFLAGSALLMLSPLWGWTVFCAVVASVAWVHVIATGQAYDILFNCGTAVISGLIVFGVMSLTKLIAELVETRTQLAKMAISEERLRFARDLHDLLGLSLSAVTLKSDLTLRLLDIDPDKAAKELLEILDLARQALADVRSVAGSYRELSLDDEYRSAQSVLAAADVRVRMDVEDTELPVLVRTVLAVVLRESVTNVLRHSKAEHCDIVIRQTDGEVSLDIVNDGVARAEPLSASGAKGPAVVTGSGIRNLSYRVAKLGGELQTGLDKDGRFRLRVSLPVQ
ncbi:sensor histidine kinase [Catenulispora sp. GAS73]|uniref:sensor histidine kinase n=1 Tax=Catenulispora sp. GAS73 TaxID=3156269 RepID=UPI00351936ED